jgi:hypothetical protein
LGWKWISCNLSIIEIQQPEVPQPPEVVPLVALTDDHQEIPHLPIFPPLIDEEIGLDQLIGDDEMQLLDNIEEVQPLVQELANDEHLVEQ